MLSDQSHPARLSVSADWLATATSRPENMRRHLLDHPKAPVVLDAGIAFDVLDLPAELGTALLGRLLAEQLPAIDSGTGRVLLLVAPQGRGGELATVLASLEPELRERLDVRYLGCGGHLVMPALDGSRGPARWLRLPGPQWKLPTLAELWPEVVRASGLGWPVPSAAADPAAHRPLAASLAD